MVQLCIPTLSRFDTLLELCRSVTTSTVKPNSVAIVDNSGGKLDIGPYVHLLSVVGVDVKLFVPRENLGVARSWNFFMQAEPGLKFILNDDVTLQADCLEKMLITIGENPVSFHYADAHNHNAFSFFHIPDHLYWKIGPFDETFFPAYFEDNDYSRRLQLAGEPLIPVFEARYGHFGSATLKAMTPDQQAEHHASFNRNSVYYRMKWGGSPGSETYSVPFNRIRVQ